MAGDGYAIIREAIAELHFNATFTRSTQTHLTSIIYENPLADILVRDLTLLGISLIAALAEVRHALRFFYVCPSHSSFDTDF